MPISAVANTAPGTLSAISRPVRPNVGVRVAYEASMLRLIDKMEASVIYWLKAAYRDTPPVLAQDESPSLTLRNRLAGVGRRWQRKFDLAAPKIAERYVNNAFKAANSSMRMALKDAGFAVKFKLTPAMRDAADAAIVDNVGLIKSIPQQYLQKVQGTVMRGYQTGRDLAAIVKELNELRPENSNRAVLIARDQSNKLNAVVQRTRQLELGITEAIWMHSNGGKHPRPSHVKANGKRYKIAEGMLLDGLRVWPGTEINCRCVSRPVLPTM